MINPVLKELFRLNPDKGTLKDALWFAIVLGKRNNDHPLYKGFNPTHSLLFMYAALTSSPSISNSRCMTLRNAGK